jgi:putative membrane protein
VGNERDGILATWLLVDNEDEIALAELASERAENPEVKRFAQKLLADHRRMGQRLEPFASGVGAGGAVGELDVEGLPSARKELEQKQGAEFDHCFMGMAVGGHMQVNEALTIFRRHASSELESVLAEGQTTVQKHLAQAKELGKKLQRAATLPPTR